jgi:protein KTI12
MALVTITGLPCSGKSRRALEIKQYFESQQSQLEIIILSDHTLNIDPTVYDGLFEFLSLGIKCTHHPTDSRSEKPARAALFSAVQRHLNENTILIVDAPNYIKGFRYQMYCAARELKLRVCTVRLVFSLPIGPPSLTSYLPSQVYVLATPDSCKQWNTTRTDGRAYTPETSVLPESFPESLIILIINNLFKSLENLIARYEEPSSMVRWDSPLFTVPWSEPDVPGAQIWDAITTATVKPPNAGTQAVPKAPTDALRALEQSTSSVISAIMNEQAASGALGGPTNLSLPSTSIRITLPARTITLSELHRLKRQFVSVHKKAITLGTTEKGTVDWTEERTASKFVTYLEENLKS